MWDDYIVAGKARDALHQDIVEKNVDLKVLTIRSITHEVVVLLRSETILKFGASAYPETATLVPPKP